MDLYAPDETVASLEADVARSESAPVAAELAWHLRQRDTARSLALATRLEASLVPRPKRCALASSSRELNACCSNSASTSPAPSFRGSLRSAARRARSCMAMRHCWKRRLRTWKAILARSSQACSAREERLRGGGRRKAHRLRHGRGARLHHARLPAEAHDQVATLREAWSDPALAAQLDYTAGILEFIAGHFGDSIECSRPRRKTPIARAPRRWACVRCSPSDRACRTWANGKSRGKVAERALTRARALGWPRWIGAALAHLGRLFTYMEEPDKAIEVLEESRQIFAVQPHSRYHAMVLFYLGDALLHSEDAVRALEMLDRSEAIVRHLGLPPEIAANLAISARAKAKLGRRDEALTNANDALALSRSCGAKLWESESLRSLAHIHLETAPREALRYLESALEVSVALGGHHEKSLLWVEIARVHERTGDLAAALAAERTARTEQLAEQNRRASNQAVVSRMRHEMEALAIREAQMRRLASMDPLTGLANRRHFFSLAEAEVIRARRYGGPLGLIMADIDKFKRINDTRGHPAGDAVLTAVAITLAGEARPNDVVARLGGEEFAVLLPSADIAAVMTVAERLRARVEALGVAWEGQRIPVTISLGCASAEPGADDRDSPLAFFESLVRQADEALYAAKAAGRNCCVASGYPAKTTA